MGSHKCTDCDFVSKWSTSVNRHFIRKHIIDDKPRQSICNPSQSICNPSQPICNSNQLICNSNQLICNPRQSICNPIIFDKNQCEKCEKILSSKQNYTKHIENCKGKINILECLHCKKQFTLHQAKYRHQKNCLIKQEKLEEELKKAKEEEELKEKTKEQAPLIQNIGNQTNIAGNQTTNIININSFGKENKDYITRDFILKCFEDGEYGVCQMLYKIYFDEQHPENHNVKLGSLRNNYVEIKRDRDWMIEGLNNTLQNMIRTASDDIICSPDLPEVCEKNAVNYQSISQISESIEKRLRENTKSKLIQRRRLSQVNKSIKLD